MARSSHSPPVTFLKSQEMVLADRFQLKVHRETREQPQYLLVVAKKGIRLKEPAPGRNSGISSERCGVMKGTRATMSTVAVVLSRRLERPVVDRTGLTGQYDFEMTYMPDSGCGLRQPESSTGESEQSSLFTAIQEQLGLRLEAAKGPVEVLVIDQAEKPSPN